MKKSFNKTPNYNHYLNEDWYKNPKKIHSDLLDILIKNLPKKRIKKTILDVGCGTGELLYILKKKLTNNYNFIGLEPQKKLLERAKKKNDKNVKFIQGSILNKNTKINSLASAVVCCGVLSLFDDFKKIINNLIKLTSKKDGVIVICSVFNDFPFDVLVKYKPSTYKKNNYMSGWNTFSIKSVSHFLKKQKQVKSFKFNIEP